MTSDGQQPLSAAYFDGRTSRRYTVTLVLDEHAVVHIVGDGVDRFEPLAAIRISEPLGGAPRVLAFADGGFCEVSDLAALEPWLRRSGHRDSPVARAQSRWSWAVGAVALLLVVLAAGYRYGVPWAAREIAERLPGPLVDQLSERSLQFLDRAVFEPSALPAARRERIGTAFRRLTPPDGLPVPHEVLFRSAPHIGANALALPSGTIVVTDELVRLTEADDEILAVLAHELGHVHERHGLRLLVESSIVGFALTWWLGDVSSLAASVPAALLQARFSREHERAADAYGARLLAANGRSPELLAGMLEKLEKSHGGPGHAARRDEAAPSDYLSSHPATRERIEALRRSAATGRRGS